MAKDETQKRSPFFQMKPLERQGYCIKCNVIFMAGAQPLMHRFTKGMYCDGCAKAYEQKAPGEVTTSTTAPSESVTKKLSAIDKRLKRIEKILEAMAESMDVDIDDEEVPAQPTANKTPTQLTADMLWSNASPRMLAERENISVEIDREKKEVRTDSLTLAYQFKTIAERHGYKSFGLLDGVPTQAGAPIG